MNHNRILFLLGLFVSVFCVPLAAQNVPTEGAEGLSELVPSKDKTLIDLVFAGGWAMVPLGILSVATVGFGIYNFLLIRRNNFISDEVIESLDAAVLNRDIEGAKRVCEENPGPVTNTFSHGLDQVQKDEVIPAAVEKAFENASSKELSGAFVVVNYLSIIAALSPMVGLLGTVSGMVKAFNSIAEQGMGKPELLADNISEALITTATGMAIAVPAMFFYFFFRNKFGKITAEVNLVLGRLYADLIRSL